MAWKARHNEQQFCGILGNGLRRVSAVSDSTMLSAVCKRCTAARVWHLSTRAVLHGQKLCSGHTIGLAALSAAA